MKQPLPSHLTVLALVALMLPAPSGSLGVVLCIGEDGHVAAEPALRGACGPQPQAADRISTELEVAVPADGHCGPCGDVPMLQSAARASRTMSGAPTLATTSLAWCVALPSLADRASWKPVAVEPPRGPTLASLRSVVLLT
ncbi:MAG: hypothetical protein U0166_01060 [Acidobacteriota bacterium]